MTEAQVERLALLAEECAEVIVVVGKILRHGFESYDPTHPNGVDSPTNQEMLGHELGDVEYALSLLSKHGEVSARDVLKGRALAEKKKPKYLHYQE